MDSWSRRFSSARIRCLPLLSVPPAPAAAETTTTVSSSADDAVSDAISECQLPLIQQKKKKKNTPTLHPCLVVLNNTIQIWNKHYAVIMIIITHILFTEEKKKTRKVLSAFFLFTNPITQKKALSLSTCAPRAHRNRNYMRP